MQYHNREMFSRFGLCALHRKCCGVIKASLCVYCFIVYPMTMCVNECVYFYVLVSRVTRAVHFLKKSLPFNMCGPVVIYDPVSPSGGHWLTLGDAPLGASSCWVQNARSHVGQGSCVNIYPTDKSNTSQPCHSSTVGLVTIHLDNIK